MARHRTAIGQTPGRWTWIVAAVACHVVLAHGGCASSDRNQPPSPKGFEVDMSTNSASGAAPTLTLIGDLPDLHGGHLALHPDGKGWAVADSRTVQLGGEDTANQRVSAPGPIHHLAFSDDGKALLACPYSYDMAAASWAKSPSLGALLAAGLDDPPPLEQLGVAAGVCARSGGDMVVVSRFQPTRELGATDSYTGPDERLLLVAADGTLSAVLHAGDGELRALAMSERHVAAGGADILLWRRESPESPIRLAHHKLVVRALAFDASGERLAAVAADGEVSLWDVAKGELLASWQADAHVLAMHPRLPLVATGSQDGKLRLWSHTGRMEREEMTPGWVQAVAFDPAGTRLAALTRSAPPHLLLYRLAETPAAE